MNIFTFTGNLGKDAEVRVIPNGKSVCSFSVAVKSGFGDKSKTTWVSCGLFGKRSEGNLPSYLVKGAQVCVSGEVFIDEWEKDGVINKVLKVNVDKLDLIGGKDSSQSQQRQQSSPSRTASSRPAPSRPAPQSSDEFDDGIPF